MPPPHPPVPAAAAPGGSASLPDWKLPLASFFSASSGRARERRARTASAQTTAFFRTFLFQSNSFSALPRRRPCEPAGPLGVTAPQKSRRGAGRVLSAEPSQPVPAPARHVLQVQRLHAAPRRGHGGRRLHPTGNTRAGAAVPRALAEPGRARPPPRAPNVPGPARDLGRDRRRALPRSPAVGFGMYWGSWQGINALSAQRTVPELSGAWRGFKITGSRNHLGWKYLREHGVQPVTEHLRVSWTMAPSATSRLSLNISGDSDSVTFFFFSFTG